MPDDPEELFPVEFEFERTDKGYMIVANMHIDMETTERYEHDMRFETLAEAEDELDKIRKRIYAVRIQKKAN